MRTIYFLLFFLFVIPCVSIAQEFNATVSIQTQKIENQVDVKIFTQLQSQLKNFINQRKWTPDTYTNEEKIESNFYITIDATTSPDVYEAKLSVIANRPVYNSNFSTTLLNMQDAAFTFKYKLSQPIEFNENKVQGSDPLEANLTATVAYYIYIILGLDYDSFELKAGAPYYTKALNVVYNAPEGSGIAGWKSYDGQRNRFILADNLTKSSFDKIHEIYYQYYRQGLDQMVDQPAKAKIELLNALLSMKEVQEANVNSMIVPIWMQGKTTEIIGVFESSDKIVKKQLLDCLSIIDITNINKYKEKFE